MGDLLDLLLTLLNTLIGKIRADWYHLSGIFFCFVIMACIIAIAVALDRILAGEGAAGNAA